MKRVLFWAFWGTSGGILALAGAAACGSAVGVFYPGSDAGLDGAFPSDALEGPGVGRSCGADAGCRSGLVCAEGTCKACACDEAGSACVLNDDCSSGSFCGPARTCAPGGTGPSGTPCTSDGDCGSGLRCNLTGLSAECQPEGAGDVGATCAQSRDCLGGLECVLPTASLDDATPSAPDQGSCEPNPPTEQDDGAVSLAPPPTVWPGETCTDVTGPTLAYFRVPRTTDGGALEGDFYRLPFPNDVRRNGATIDLTGHPTPGSALLGFDLIQRWLDYLSTDNDGGFSTYPTVFFRFSASIDGGTTLHASGAIRWIDITTPTAPGQLGLEWTETTGRDAYICNNSVAVRPPLGQPLTPGHTYAVVLMNSILDATMQPILVDSDLTALLAPAAPTDAVLAPQWPKYAPLRAWAAAAGVATSSILDATVFTVGQPTALGPKLAAAVAAAPAPVATSWIRCDGSTPSPCPQATGDRACGTPDPAFDELHAMITLPIFQQGTEPYVTPDQGGDFVLGSDGTPVMQRTEQVCMSLTVPKGAPMPAGGWPVLVYAHGTGGSFRSEVPEGVAGREASIGNGAGGTIQVAVLGIDQVDHGTRRGTSTDSPDNLFFNFSNPAAAHGNPLQGAADQMSLVRFVTGFDLPAATSPTGAEIKLGSIAFWGHSQGATEGGIAMPYTSGVTGAVLSGEGASVIDALLNKTNPVDIAAELPIALEDAPGNITEYHPVLALLQNALDPVDPLNHALPLVQAPTAKTTVKNVFQPYGQDDTYAPPITEQTFALAAQLGEAAPPSGVSGAPLGPTAQVPVPVGGNAMVDGLAVTAIVRQYAPSPPGAYDGHFVSYDNPTAEADVDHFIGDCVSEKTPLVGR